MVHLFRKWKLICLIVSFAVLPLLPMSMLLERVVPLVLERSEALSFAITRVATALGLLTIKLGSESVNHTSKKTSKSSNYFDELLPSPLFFLQEQLKEITKQQHVSNKSKNKKEDPKGISGATSIVAGALATKFKEECKKHKHYFISKLTENKLVLDKIAQDIGIKIKSINLEHIFKPTSILGDTKLAGGHAVQLQQFAIKKIITGTDPENKCYSALISVASKTSQLVVDTKSQFPSSWDAKKIIDVFFKCAETTKLFRRESNGVWLVIHDTSQQAYRLFLDNKGIIKTFFPQVLRV